LATLNIDHGAESLDVEHGLSPQFNISHGIRKETG